MTVVAVSQKTDNLQASFQVAVKSDQLLSRLEQGIDATMQNTQRTPNPRSA
jgi:hypothetical protein